MNQQSQLAGIHLDADMFAVLRRLAGARAEEESARNVAQAATICANAGKLARRVVPGELHQGPWIELAKHIRRRAYQDGHGEVFDAAWVEAGKSLAILE